VFDWAVASAAAGDDTPPGWGRWELVRRQILTADQIAAGKEPELAYYLCAGPPRTTDDDLIRVAGAQYDSPDGLRSRTSRDPTAARAVRACCMIFSNTLLR